MAKASPGKIRVQYQYQYQYITSHSPAMQPTAQSLPSPLVLLKMLETPAIAIGVHPLNGLSKDSGSKYNSSAVQTHSEGTTGMQKRSFYLIPNWHRSGLTNLA